MKNSKLRRVLLLLACAVMLVSLSVGATLAYLSSTDTVVNTFTVGQVNITLDEADVWESKTDEGYPAGTQLGTAKGENYDRVQQNNYKVYPGMTYDKDPTVHVIKDSEDCYVAVHIKVNNFDALYKEIGYTTATGGKYLGFENIVTGGVLAAENGVTSGGELAAGKLACWYGRDRNNNDMFYTLYQIAGTGDFYVVYPTPIVTLDAAENTDLVLFTDITVPKEWGNDEIKALDNLNMNIEAYAVQAEGFPTWQLAFQAAFPEAFEWSALAGS